MTPRPDYSLMLVTDPIMTRHRGLVSTVLEAVAGGVTIVQLRDKTTDDATLAAAARALKAPLTPLSVPLIVNDRPAVAKAAGADGVHIGQSDGDPETARAIIGPDAIVGLSVTADAEVETVDPGIVDYVGLGPVFSSATKADAAAPLGLTGFRGLGAQLPVPFVAIGGVDHRNAAAVMEAGAAGIACVSAICATENPHEAAATLRRAMQGGIAA
ncbi:thiamine phosphate synthase [Bauldia sp.]|uniref:thiamine phosphate synthase n=1 Tax=Bauldia sp. TaxID=2575872 RepID=UPI003BABBAB8